jgi:hypothetical protein
MSIPDHLHSPPRVSASYILLEIFWEVFEMDQDEEPDDCEEWRAYPEFGDFDSFEEYYPELRLARKQRGLPIDIPHEDVVEPDFKAKFAIAPENTIKASRIWPLLIEEFGQEVAEEFASYLQGEKEWIDKAGGIE